MKKLSSFVCVLCVLAVPVHDDRALRCVCVVVVEGSSPAIAGANTPQAVAAITRGLQALRACPRHPASESTVAARPSQPCERVRGGREVEPALRASAAVPLRVSPASVLSRSSSFLSTTPMTIDLALRKGSTGGSSNSSTETEMP